MHLPISIISWVPSTSSFTQNYSRKYNITASTLIFIAVTCCNYKLTATTSTSIKASLPIAIKSTTTMPLQTLHQHHVRTVSGPTCIYTLLTMAANDSSCHLHFHQCYPFHLKCIKLCCCRSPLRHIPPILPQHITTITNVIDNTSITIVPCPPLSPP